MMPRERCTMDTVNSVRNSFALISTLIVMLIQTKNECDNSKREAEKFKKEVDLLKQEIKRMKKDDVEKGPSINDKYEGESITESSHSLLNKQQMTSPNYDTENPYFETCGIRISMKGHNHPDTETIQHSLPSDLDHFNNLRREGKDFDKQIINGDGLMNVHKTLLSGRIPFFKYLLNPSWSESSINLSEFDSPVIESLINWAYSGVISINLENVQGIMRAASYLLIESIVDECYLFMRRRIQFDDALPLLQFCRAIDYNKNDESLIKFIESNFLLISNTADFLELSLNDLVNIINRNFLNVDNDEQILDAVNRWIGKDENRRKIVPRLLKSVRSPRLSSSFLNDIVEKNPWIMNIPESIALINQAQEIASNSLISLKSVPWNCGHSLIVVTRENEYDIHDHDTHHDDFIRVEIYDTTKNEWHQSQIEYRRLPGDALAVVGDHIYFYGHYKDHNVDVIEDSGTMIIYDTTKNQWQELRMPSLVFRRFALTGVIDGIIYSTGGEPDDLDLSKSLTKFDPSNPSAGWTRLANMRRVRGKAATCVLNGRLYVIGGYDENEQTDHFDGEYYDPTIDKWTIIADLPDEREVFAAATLGGEIYVVGYTTLTKYSPATDTWTKLKNMNYEKWKRILVSSGGKLFVCGRGLVYSIERYDPLTDNWTEMASMSEWLREDRRELIMWALPVPSSLPIPNLEGLSSSDIANE